jgi:diguanylate cyclase (GGDEF)-like protein
MEDSASISGDVRSRTSALIRGRQEALTHDVTSAISRFGDILDREAWRGCAELLLRLFATSVDAGSLDAQSAAMRDLARYSPPLNMRQLLNCVHRAEGVILDDLALDARLGATSEPWAIVAHAIHRATLEILGAHAEQVAGRGASAIVRDPLTTLITSPVFMVALAQEIERSLRHQHALALVLFDIDDLAHINRDQGWGVGDRILERMGILARRFFRTHDWVARYGDDAIAVLLPETTVDQAAVLALRFREMVQQRLVQQDHKTETTTLVTVSAAAVGTDLVQSEIDAAVVMQEAEAAVLRAKFYGRNRIERVALLPTSVTIFGAATMLEQTPHEVSRLVRAGKLKAARRGRHFHIERDQIDAYRKLTREH